MRLSDFAQRHPRLYRLAHRGAHVGIRRHGLLPATTIAHRAGQSLPTVPRKEAIRFTLTDGSEVVVTDNKPLSFAKLAPCLDDALAPEDWLAMLNARVFFWPKRDLGKGNLGARKRFDYVSEWQIYDTRNLLGPVWQRAEIAPINTGSTIHQPARRGFATFAPLHDVVYDAWRRRRGLRSLDQPKEVTVRGEIPNAGDALLDVEDA